MAAKTKTKPSKKEVLSPEDRAYYRAIMERIINRLVSTDGEAVVLWKGQEVSLRGRVTATKEDGVSILKERTSKLFVSDLVRRYEGRNADSFKRRASHLAEIMFDIFVEEGSISPL